MPKTVTIYAVIKAHVEVADTFNEEDDGAVEEWVSSEADYNFSVDHDSLKVTDTELIACLTKNPT